MAYVVDTTYDRFVSCPCRFDFIYRWALTFYPLFVLVYKVLGNVVIEQGLCQVSGFGCNIHSSVEVEVGSELSWPWTVEDSMFSVVFFEDSVLLVFKMYR